MFSSFRRPEYDRARRRLLAASAGVAGVAALAAAGCGSSTNNKGNNAGSNGNAGKGAANGTPGASSGAAQGTAAAAGTPVVGQPKRGGTITVVDALDPQHLDPHTLITPAIVNFYSLASNRLLRVQGGSAVQPTSYTVIPDAATALPEQPDPLTYVFKLKPGINWQNLPPVAGRPLEAADYKFTIERLGTNKPEFIYRYLTDAIDKVTATDAQTLTITTKQPYARLVQTMALPMLSVVAHEVVERDGNLQTTLVGTGPFQLSQWTPKVGAKFVRNPGYFEQGLPYLDEVDYTFISDQSARLSAFLSGQVDILNSGSTTITPDNLSQVKSSLANATIEKFSAVGGNEYMFMADKPPFNDLRVRQAFHYAIDRAKQIQVDAAGDADWRTGPLSSGFTDWTRSKSDIQADGPLDLKKAKDLLTAAGQTSFKMNMMAASDVPDEIAWSEFAQQQLKGLGIDVTVQSVPHADYLNAQVKRSFDPGQVYAIRAYPDPDDYLYPLFYSQGSKNYANINDPKLDQLLLAQRQELDAGKRKQILQQIDHEWINYVYHVYSYTANQYQGFQARVKNFQYTALGELTQLRNTWAG
jgi:peptide/nickel transport system substrate-binding protein